MRSTGRLYYLLRREAAFAPEDYASSLLRRDATSEERRFEMPPPAKERITGENWPHPRFGQSPARTKFARLAGQPVFDLEQEVVTSQRQLALGSPRPQVISPPR